MSYCLEKTHRPSGNRPHLHELIPEQEKRALLGNTLLGPAMPGSAQYFSFGVKGLELGASSLEGKVAPPEKVVEHKEAGKVGHLCTEGTNHGIHKRVVWGLHHNCYHLVLNLKEAKDGTGLRFNKQAHRWFILYSKQMLLLSALISDSKYFMLKELKSVISHLLARMDNIWRADLPEDRGRH